MFFDGQSNRKRANAGFAKSNFSELCNEHCDTSFRLTSILSILTRAKDIMHFHDSVSFLSLRSSVHMKIIYTKKKGGNQQLYLRMLAQMCVCCVGHDGTA